MATAPAGGKKRPPAGSLFPGEWRDDTPRSTSGEVGGLSSRLGRVRLPHGVLLTRSLTTRDDIHCGDTNRIGAALIRRSEWVRLPPLQLSLLGTRGECWWRRNRHGAGSACKAEAPRFDSSRQLCRLFQRPECLSHTQAAGVRLPHRQLVGVHRWVLRLGTHSVSKTDGSSCGVRFLTHLLFDHGPVGQPGVAASLSRRRSGVQIPSGLLPGDGRYGSVS